MTYTFDCQMYVSARQVIRQSLPQEDGPRPIARFQAVAFQDLIDPDFRQLLVALNTVPVTPTPLVLS